MIVEVEKGGRMSSVDSSAESSHAAGAVRYIIVVHGMGESRFNETVLAVVNRFAEARSATVWPPPAEIVSLGMACGQTGLENSVVNQPWLEFVGIPRDPLPLSNEPFYGGGQTSPPGRLNLRFVDMHWKDLLAGAWPSVGQDPDLWLDALVGRLRRKDQWDQKVPQWALETLGILRETIRLIHAFLRLRFKSFDELVFGQYLGDVQLYGEYAMVRGQAVRRFHQRLAAIEACHRAKGDRYSSKPAHYTVISHSLGTVMAMDALLYAHAKDSKRSEKGSGQGVPLAGYFDPDMDAESPNVDWIERVDALVTLGSPIDKFLTIWWLNYLHLNDTRPWLNPVARKIRHFNFCEEQDPVGQHLFLLETAEAYKQVFHKEQDEVYTRYVWPGLAHIAYWKDRALFEWILRRAVDQQPPSPPEPQWYNPRLHNQILFITYIFIPFIVVAVSFFTFTLAFGAQTLHAAVAATLVFAGTTLVGRYLIDLMVIWRQVLRNKHEEVTQSSIPRDLLDWLRGLPKLIGIYPQGQDEKTQRFRRENEFRNTLRMWEYGSLTAGALFIALYLRIDAEFSQLHLTRLALMAAVFTAALFVWWQLFRHQDAAWRKSLSSPDLPPTGGGGGGGDGGSGSPPPGSAPGSDAPFGAGIGQAVGESPPPSRPPADFSQAYNDQWWFKPDAIDGVKAVLAVIVGCALSKCAPLTDRMYDALNFVFRKNQAVGTRYTLAAIAAAFLSAAVVGYVRHRMNEIAQWLMQDRVASVKKKNVRTLKKMTFSDYVGIKATSPDEGDSTNDGS